MSQFFAVRNLTEKSLAPCVPWDFRPAQQPSEKICLDKTSRQEWYRTKSTEWNFYSGIEPANPNQRASKDNPPKYIHAFVADYDLPITKERIYEAIELFSIKPSWIERSLGGNCRLIWTLLRPIPVETNDFAIWILQHARKFLATDLLPGLDAAALEDPARLYCNGGQWEATGHKAIDETKLQSFFVEAARKFKFKVPDAAAIPLEIVAVSLRERFPGFSWPSEFSVDTQGPSFWIAGSTSPLSAIVKSEGMLTFAAHADKMFYTWSDILGPEFVKNINAQSIAKATLDIFYDGQSYYRKIDGAYQTANDGAMKIYLKEGCGIAAKKVDATLHHLHENCRVAGAAPFIFQEPGLIEYGGRKILNTWRNSVLQPAESSTGVENTWIWYFLNSLFEPLEQLDWALSWFQHFYRSAIELLPRPGQNIFLFGTANKGKTFWSREIVGKAVGGFVDASDYLVRGDSFGSENFHVPLWSIDDSTPGNSASGYDRFAAMLKKAAANQQHRYNAKFQIPTTVCWSGRVIITANVDFQSSRILGSLDNTSADKTSVFRSTNKQIDFPERYKLQKILKTELPVFCRWLLDWEPPAHIPRDGRYGFAPYHESTILDSTHQTSKSAPFKEILIEELQAYFAASPEATEWRGTLSQLFRMIQLNPANDFLLRSFKPEMVSRYLELIERENIIKCRTEVGDKKTRIWIFPK